MVSGYLSGSGSFILTGDSHGLNPHIVNQNKKNSLKDKIY